MVPNSQFINKEDRFWAIVKMVSETLKYSVRKKGNSGTMRRFTTEDVLLVHDRLKISTDYCFKDGKPLQVTNDVVSYLNFRSEILENYIKAQLMNREESRAQFEKLKLICPDSKINIQMNKQKGDKKHPNYLTGMVNLVAEQFFKYGNFNPNPLGLGIISDSTGPLKTLCRRMDGVFPSTSNTKLMWEIKEYYGTTTFGSRIADGVYETMLVGEELKSLYKDHGIKIFHVLFVDDYNTWWNMGRSYLCRLVDMLHIGQVDAIFFGREVTTEWVKFLELVQESPSK